MVLCGEENGPSKNEWIQFKNDIDDFGILTWNVEELSSTVDLPNLTTEIENGSITTGTYQKPINLYQYITPNSAHPPWMIKSMIVGMLWRYYNQNNYRENY